MTATTLPDPYLELEKDAQDLLFRSARTANAFTDEPVSDDQVRAIHDLVKWGPTAMNTQPLRVVLVRSPDARGRLVEHMSDGNKAKTSIAPLTLVLAADVDFHDELPRVSPTPSAPGTASTPTRPAASGWRSSTLSCRSAYLLVGIRAAGLGRRPDDRLRRGRRVDAEFFPDGRHRSLVVVNVGHPAEDAFRDRQPRLEYEDVVITV